MSRSTDVSRRCLPFLPGAEGVMRISVITFVRPRGRALVSYSAMTLLWLPCRRWPILHVEHPGIFLGSMLWCRCQHGRACQIPTRKRMWTSYSAAYVEYSSNRSLCPTGRLSVELCWPSAKKLNTPRGRMCVVCIQKGDGVNERCCATCMARTYRSSSPQESAPLQRTHRWRRASGQSDWSYASSSRQCRTSSVRGVVN